MSGRTVEDLEKLQTNLRLRLLAHGATMTADERQRTEAHLDAVDEVLRAHRSLTSQLASASPVIEVESNDQVS